MRCSLNYSIIRTWNCFFFNGPKKTSTTTKTGGTRATTEFGQKATWARQSARLCWSATIDTSKGIHVMIIDILVVFMHALSKDKDIILFLKGPLVETMVLIHSAWYHPHITYNNKGVPMLYITVNKALYGLLRLALDFHLKLWCKLEEKGYETNPYDSCVVDENHWWQPNALSFGIYMSWNTHTRKCLLISHLWHGLVRYTDQNWPWRGGNAMTAWSWTLTGQLVVKWPFSDQVCTQYSGGLYPSN